MAEAESRRSRGQWSTIFVGASPSQTESGGIPRRENHIGVSVGPSKVERRRGHLKRMAQPVQKRIRETIKKISVVEFGSSLVPALLVFEKLMVT